MVVVVSTLPVAGGMATAAAHNMGDQKGSIGGAGLGRTGGRRGKREVAAGWKGNGRVR